MADIDWAEEALWYDDEMTPPMWLYEWLEDPEDDLLW